MNLYEKGLRRALALSLSLYLVIMQVSFVCFAACTNIPTDEPHDVTEEVIPEEPPETIPIVESEPEFKPILTLPEYVPLKPDKVLPTVQYYNVPLSEDLQSHIFKLCKEHGLDPALVIAMINKESNFIPNIMGDNGNSYGLMQIQLRYNHDRMKRLGCDDLLDPYQNVTVGIDILAEFFSKGKPVEWVLMAYNGGMAYANRKWNAGEISYYAQRVLEIRDNLTFKESNS